MYVEHHKDPDHWFIRFEDSNSYLFFDVRSDIFEFHNFIIDMLQDYKSFDGSEITFDGMEQFKIDTNIIENDVMYFHFDLWNGGFYVHATKKQMRSFVNELRRTFN